MYQIRLEKLGTTILESKRNIQDTIEVFKDDNSTKVHQEEGAANNTPQGCQLSVRLLPSTTHTAQVRPSDSIRD